MTEPRIDVAAALADLKDFQRRTALWAFERMFADHDPALRFLVADEVGLGKTHVAKGVIAQVIDYLGRTGDERHDIVYMCSNAAIARQNLRKLAPKGIEPRLVGVDRLTMLPLVDLKEEQDGKPGINLLAITPGTSLRFGRSTGTFSERALAYTLLRRRWGTEVMDERARHIFWLGLRKGSREYRDGRLRRYERWYRPRVRVSPEEFATRLEQVDAERRLRREQSVRELFDEIVDGLTGQGTFRGLWALRRQLIAEVRRVMAIVGIDALRPDLVVLDEFQRFKDLLRPDPGNLATELARALFEYRDPDTDRPTRTLLLSATPYRMYTTADDTDSDHYKDFVDTCEFLYQDAARVEGLQRHFADLRNALTASVVLDKPEAPLAKAAEICDEIGSDLRHVMARTERLAATPDRDGMLQEPRVPVSVAPDDLRSYVRLGDLASVVKHYDPTEYWKSAPYLVNFMEHYKLKKAIELAIDRGRFVEDEHLGPGPRAVELVGCGELPARRLSERTAPVADRRPGAPPSVRASMGAAIDPLLRHRLGIRIAGGPSIHQASDLLGLARSPEGRVLAGQLRSGASRLREPPPRLLGRVPTTWWPAAHVPHQRADNHRGSSRRRFR